MERDHIASLKQDILRINGMYTGSLNHFLRAVSIVGIAFHAEAGSHASHITAHIAEGQDTQFLALQLGTCLAVEEVAHGKYQQTEHQLSHSIAVLARSVHHTYVMSGSCIQVHIVVTSTGTHHNLQLLGSIQHLIVHFVAADNQGIGILHGIQKLSLLGIFLQQGQFIACCLYLLADTFHSYGCERLFCSN